MIRLDTIGELRRLERGDLPSRGIVLDADEVSLRGLPIPLYSAVDLLPAGALGRACELHCTCSRAGSCPACRVGASLQSQLVEGGTP